MAQEPDIKVESYRNVAFEKGWIARSGGLWGTASAAAVLAATLIGPIAPFFPVLVGAQDVSVAVASIPTSMLAFGAVGMASGFAVGASVGAAAGAAAGVAEEQERR